jgi:aminoglycoside phosphotransferase (APT) family kinase protein
MKPDPADPMAAMLPAVHTYLETVDWSGVPVMADRRFRVQPLARGEYNLNYLLSSEDVALVLRVNVGTQIGRDDQIVYEYKALKLLEDSGYTPRPYAVDDSRRHIPRGICIMAFLPGRPLDYRTDLAAAARLLAAIHQVQVPAAENHLIREESPLSLIYEECAGLLARYFDSDLADPDIRDFLGEVLAWAAAARHRERYFQADPWPAIVNTEVNSGNFIVNPDRKTIHLVDWEMPRWGDPSTDLCHFCSPLTTLWKTDYRMSPADRQGFLAAYRAAVHDRHLKDTLAERVRLKDPFVHLRGISWSAMGWVAYQTDYAGIRNPDTWATLQRYMDLGFIRALFEPLMGG